MLVARKMAPSRQAAWGLVPTPPSFLQTTTHLPETPNSHSFTCSLIFFCFYYFKQLKLFLLFCVLELSLVQLYLHVCLVEGLVALPSVSSWHQPLKVYSLHPSLPPEYPT